MAFTLPHECCQFRLLVSFFALLCLSLNHVAVASSTGAAFVSVAPINRVPPLSPSRHNTKNRALALSASSSDDNEKAGSTSRSARDRGIYARPSAAIERGSGFFIPGLEGSRIRFTFGITVLLADAANHFLVGGQPGDWGQTVAEVVSAFYGALLLLQGSIELGVEKGLAEPQAVGGDDEGIISAQTDDSGTIVNNSRSAASALQEDEAASRMIQRLAQTIIAFTPATYFRFLDEDLGVLYSYGVTDADNLDADEQKRLAKLSIDALSDSRGGRVALPSEHPASKLLPAAATRCILVQKLNGYKNSRGCLIIGSDKLLQSFTKNDLRWIGQLADYNNLIGEKS
mmetsp:Transcript_16398/g.34668  ORF Transcript_16398/g.34668 Transcript_16398/m.34668 type:complete len:343 (-) Transcript_16398:101-1129(-)|eukprot:CAMPEP_0183729808 /NCGR_PEP_ID=MMETSP0737-20130205/31288_1 /TAXON_ID=385413 /ORGANISM="Thalassiosira miniscula, Strain CCMP1093" /LENGTH=342 /DNA_ID=CAMNT_0025962113 /DNA_START=122 /DNA_END=1150 /DNA_ORIENTATION=-